ncbi:MAG: U32 family peptidase [Thermoguttaceae bacterium]|nr:U32 family peptidase [Thermoguttaceae bacterium]
MTQHIIKITAPAGDQARFEAALKGGADEIYMGLSGYGARRFAGNFSCDEYCKSIDQAHRAGATVHLTLNTIMSERELDTVGPQIKKLYHAGLDAVIVQDFGVARWLRSFFPELPIHASTQMSVVSLDELQFLQSQGFARVVLARELSGNEIAELARHSSIELEVFASGALCLACSGKCLLSSFIGGRSGNRGACAQPCRHLWRKIRSSLEGRLPDESPIEDEIAEGFFLSLKDQWQGRDVIAQLSHWGVESIKIEGRMKSPNYVYEAVLHYRRLIDSIAEQDAHGDNGSRSPYTSGIRLALKSDPPTAGNHGIERIFNRGYAKGYFIEHDPDMINSRFSSNFGVEIGRVSNGAITLSAPVRNGDGIVYLDARLNKLGGHNVSWIDLLHDGKREILQKVDSAQAGQRVRFEHFPPPDTAFVYKTSDYELNRDLTSELEQVQRFIPIEATLTAQIDQPLELTLRKGEIAVKSQTAERLAPAQKRLTTADDLRQSLDRFGQTPFYLANCRIESDGKAFVPKSILNSLRQTCSSELEKKIVESFRRTTSTPQTRDPDLGIEIPDEVPDTMISSASSLYAPGTVVTPGTPVGPGERVHSFFAVVRTNAQFEACQRFGVPNIARSARCVDFDEMDETHTKREQGLPLAASLRKLLWYEKRDMPFAADWTFNIANIRAARFFADSLNGLSTLFLSPEISEETARKIASGLNRPSLKLGLPVYGHLAAMYTRKTLFDEPVVSLANHDDHPITVVRNSFWYDDGQHLTGSTVYDGIALDIVNSVGRILRWGIDVVRFEFTFESAAEVLDILKRADHPDEDNRTYHSYGFGRGIF